MKKSETIPGRGEDRRPRPIKQCDDSRTAGRFHEQSMANGRVCQQRGWSVIENKKGRRNELWAATYIVGQESLPSLSRFEIRLSRFKRPGRVDAPQAFAIRPPLSRPRRLPGTCTRIGAKNGNVKYGRNEVTCRQTRWTSLRRWATTLRWFRDPRFDFRDCFFPCFSSFAIRDSSFEFRGGNP